LDFVDFACLVAASRKVAFDFVGLVGVSELGE
jgi:hypothetical protein